VGVVSDSYEKRGDYDSASRWIFIEPILWMIIIVVPIAIVGFFLKTLGVGGAILIFCALLAVLVLCLEIRKRIRKKKQPPQQKSS